MQEGGPLPSPLRHLIDKGKQMEQSEFEKNTTTTRIGSGYECKCNKGLWSVYAPTENQAISEGVHYFLQYWEDGEYLDKGK